MTVVFTLLAVLFAAKLAWNACIPLWLERNRGVSLHAHVELALLLAMMFVACRPVLVALVGTAAIVSSYAAAFALGRALGWRYQR